MGWPALLGLALLLCAVGPGRARAQQAEGMPFIRNYSPQDYQAHTSNWNIALGPQGWVYVANNAGLLEFDGREWRRIPMPNGSIVRSLALGADGRLYVGAVGELGYLEADSLGRQVFRSLLPHLPEENRLFEDVWHCFAYADQLVFLSYTQIMVWKNGRFDLFFPKSQFHLAFKTQGGILVNEPGTGFYRYGPEGWDSLPGTRELSLAKPYAVLDYDGQSVLVVDRKQGATRLWPWGERPRWESLPGFEPISRFAIENSVYAGARLGELFALGSLQDGFILFDREGAIHKHIGKAHGLGDNSVYSFCPDSLGNLWVGLNRGLSYLETQAPVTFFGEGQGLQGGVYSALSHQGRLWVGGSLGIFSSPEGEPDFSLLPVFRRQNWNWLSYKGRLYAANFDGVVELDQGQARLITPYKTFWTLRPFDHPERFLGGTHSDGLVVLADSAGHLAFSHRIKGFDETSRWVEYDSRGWVWVSHNNAGLWRLWLNERQDSVSRVDFFDPEQGLPSKFENYVFKVRLPARYWGREGDELQEEPIFGTKLGFYRFDAEAGRFVPIPELNALLLWDKNVKNSLAQDYRNNLYFIQEEEKLALLYQEDGSFEALRAPFLRLRGLFPNSISLLDSATVAFCSWNGGLYPLDLSRGLADPVAYSCQIRLATSGADTLFMGSGPAPDLVLSDSSNLLRLRWASDWFVEPELSRYAYRLLGLDTAWSAWSRDDSKELANLPPGQYVFEVKARNLYEQESRVARLRFTVLPPWYRSWWGSLLLAALALALVGLAIMLRTRSLSRRNQQLERTVRERTHEILAQNKMLEQRQEEIQQQAQVLAEANKEISDQNEELRQFRDHLQDLVDEKTQELNQARLRAESSERLKTAFLANVSHEIRTPLNAINGFSSLLKYKQLTPEKSDDFLSIILKNVDQLNRIIDDIVDISKIETDQLEFFFSDFSTRELFDELEKHFRTVAARREGIGLSCHFGLAAEQDAVHGERARLRQVLLHLLDNAFKFTHQGQVSFRCFQDDRRNVCFEVSESGIGITEAEQEVIFQAFRQVDISNSRKYGGTGLGLAICKGLLSKIGGRIELVSQKGLGSRFTVRISRAVHKA